MKIEGIKTAKKISEHLYQMGKEILPEDLLRIIRILSSKGKQLGGDYHYGRNELYYTEPSEITKDEFHKILTITKESSPSIDNVLDNRFTRDQLMDELAPFVKVKSSTRKGELIEKALREEILFQLFKELIVKEKCREWKNYVEGKIKVPSSDEEMQFVFSATAPYRKSLSNHSFTQFWTLRRNSVPLPEVRDYSSREYDDILFLNMKDKDELLLKLTRKLEQEESQEEELELNIWQKELSHKDIGVAEAEVIRYENNIDKLSEYFGRRRGSKFETFSSGLKEMADKKLIEELLGKEFLISEYDESIFIGKSFDKATFEAIASHLKLEYMEEKSIICKVEEKETSEVISAIWEMGGEYSKRFQVRALNERRKKKC